MSFRLAFKDIFVLPAFESDRERERARIGVLGIRWQFYLEEDEEEEVD